MDGSGYMSETYFKMGEIKEQRKNMIVDIFYGKIHIGYMHLMNGYSTYYNLENKNLNIRIDHSVVLRLFGKNEKDPSQTFDSFVHALVELIKYLPKTAMVSDLKFKIKEFLND